VTEQLPRVDHLGLTVTSLERSIGFYRDFVGMQLAWASDEAIGGEWFDTLTGNEGARILVATLQLGGFSLQLVEYRDAGRSQVALDHSAPGTPHLCIYVDDVERRHADASRRGLDPTPIVVHVLAPARSFYVDDPDGVPVELFQLSG
jgi:catechol 2,3-dioxygenase-like lactoylglutathione lyase family enzyme